MPASPRTMSTALRPACASSSSRSIIWRSRDRPRRPGAGEPMVRSVDGRRRPAGKPGAPLYERASLRWRANTDSEASRALEARAGPDSELGVHEMQVPLHRERAQEQARADLGVGEPLPGELGDLAL